MSLIKSLVVFIIIVLLLNDYAYGQSKLVINEILAEPLADANGDATTNADDDEFVELVNISGTSVDITGWTISDNASVRYTFPSTTVPAGGAVIVFGGGTPTGLFGGAIVQTAATLDLDNSGDIVIMKNNSGDIIDKYVYGTEADNGQSIARSPDITGGFVQHTTLAGALSFSPGKSNTNNANSFPLTTTVTASMTDALVNDINFTGDVNPGEQIEYTVTVTNTGTQNAASVNLNNTVDPNTTFVPGSIKTSPLALTDYYNTNLNTAINPNAASGVLVNDSDPDGSGAVTVISYGTSASPNTTNVGGGSTATDQSGTVTVNADGSFSYTPPNNQTGLDKFGYRIEDTDNNIQSANVEINIFGTSPSAVADNYSVLSATLLTVPDGGTDLLSNDNLGIPNGVITSFGGGTTGGTVTTNAAGATFSGSGHSLTVNANGSFTFTSASGFTGSFTFHYRVKNDAGFSDGTVTISVQSAPVAVNDPNSGLPANSTPPAGANPNPYHTALNTTLNVADGSNDLLSNDDLGSPTAAIVSYGTTGNPNAQTTIGNSTATDNGGTVSINANGSFTYNPPNATYTGTDQFAYKIENVQGSSIGTVTVAVGFRPSAVADSYGASGNIAIVLNAASGVILGTGTDVGDQTTVTEVQGLTGNVGIAAATTATGRGSVTGFVTLAADGSFTYEPPPGFVGNDTYTYKVGNGFGNSSTATVTIAITNMVWFISNTAGGLNRGTFGNPFTTIASFNTANAGTGVMPDPKNGDVIAFRTGSGTYTESDGFNLRDNQKLIGEAVQFNTVFTASANSITAYTTFASGTNTAPSIVTNAGTNHGVDLAQNNTVRGLNVGNTTGFGFNGTAVGSPVINTVSKTGNGGAINVSTSGAFSTNVTFDNLSSTNSASQGINLVGVSGTLTVTAGSITNPTGTAVNVNGGSVSMTYPGNITQSNNATTVSVSGGHTTGTITFQSGTISATNGNGLQFDNADGTYNFNGTSTLNGGDAAIDIQNGSGGTISFGNSCSITNPLSNVLNINSSTANVTYSGTFLKNNNSAVGISINVESGGTININGTSTKTLSVGTATAVNIVSNTGTTINFSNGGLSITGAAGFNVTGGGTISVTGAGNTINTSGGTALKVNATNIGASGLTFQSISANGAVNGIALNNTGNSGGLNVTGTGSANSGGTIQNTTGHGIQISNTTSGPTPLTFQYMNVTGAATGQNGINFDVPPGGSGSFGTVNITNCTISNNASTGIRANIQGTGSISRINIKNNTFTGNEIGIDLAANGTADVKFDIASNTMNGTRTQINIANNDLVHNSGLGSGPQMQGYITSNNITTSPTGNIYIAMWIVVDGDGSIIVDVNGNTINNFGDSGIDIESRGGSGRVDATVRNNVISTTATFPLAGVFLRSGNGTVGETNMLYVNLSLNNSNAGAGAVGDYYLDRFTPASTIFAIQGLTPASATPAQTEAFVITTDSAPPAAAFAENGTYIAGTPSVPSF